MEYASELISIAGTLLGAIVGGVMAYWVNKKRFQATVVAESREKWISDLRDTIAEFLTLTGELGARNELGFMNSDMVPQMSRATFLKTKIELMINPEEEQHRRIIDLTEEILEASQDSSGNQLEEMARPYKELSSLSQETLKKEWESVKSEL